MKPSLTDGSLTARRRPPGQLGAVAQARGLRLASKRQALNAARQQLDVEWTAQWQDERLLADQRARWLAQWQHWTSQTGTLRRAVGLRNDKLMLQEMATVVARQRAALQAKEDAWQAASRTWARRWQSLCALRDALAAQGRELRAASERGRERQRDEDSQVLSAAHRLALPVGDVAGVAG